MNAGIWNYLIGYVNIKLSGRGLERLINKANEMGISIWRIRRIDAGTVEACVTYQGFVALRKAIRGSGVHVRIVSRVGLPRRIAENRSRKVFFFGWLLVLAAVIIASRFVWFIKVSGCDEVSESAVLDTIGKLGIERGSYRGSFDTFGLGKEISASDRRIAWAGVSLEGVILNVEIREAEYAKEYEDKTDPASIFASKDGVITRIIARKGRPIVSAGNAVHSGEELVSGRIFDDSETTISVHADALIYARVLYGQTATVGPMLLKRVGVGISERRVELRLFGFESGKRMPEDTVRRSEAVRGLTNCFIPLEFLLFSDSKTELKNIRAETAELKAEAERIAADRALRTIPKDAKILSKESRFSINDDGSVTADVQIITEENIAETRGING